MFCWKSNECVYQIPTTFLLLTYSRRLAALIYYNNILQIFQLYSHSRLLTYTPLSTNDQLARRQADKVCSHDLWGQYQRNGKPRSWPVVKHTNTQWTVQFCTDRSEDDKNISVGGATAVRLTELGPFTDGKPNHYQEIVGKLFTSACSTTGAPFAT